MLMMKSFFVSLLLLCFNGSSVVHGGSLRGLAEQQENRTLIIGGEVAKPNDYPYFVHFASPGCGGTLIAPDIVLTAGHCKLDRVSDYETLYVGRYDLSGRDRAQAFSVVADTRHPQFDEQVCCGYAQGSWFYGVIHDFMLLKLSGVSSAPTVRLNENAAAPFNDEELHVIGMGDTDPGGLFLAPDRLHDVTVNYIPTSKCASLSVYPDNLLNDASLCALDYKEDACSGDSGGPLIKKGQSASEDIQMGVVSWGWGCASQPGVYGRVSHGYSWIRREVCRLSDSPPSSFRCDPPAQQINPPAVATPIVTPDVTTPEKMPLRITRTELPAFRPCSIASRSPEVCCSAMIGRTNTDGQSCVPAIKGELFHSGFACEAQSFVQRNDPDIYDLDFCDALMSERTLLPVGDACSTIQDRKECCQYRDNRNDGSIYDGQPCVASRKNSGFPQGRGVCEPANFVAQHSPGSAMSCADVLSEDFEQIGGMGSYTANILHTGSDEASSSNRQYLPEGRACRGISNVYVCCAARDARYPNSKGSEYRGQDCVPAFDGRFTSSRLCEPAGWASEYDPDSYDDTYCDRLLEDRAALEETRSCSDIFDAQTCCSFKDNNGEVCLPSRRPSGFSTGNQCEPASWVAAFEPTNVADCSRY